MAVNWNQYDDAWGPFGEDVHFALKLVSVKLDAFGLVFPTFNFGFYPTVLAHN